MSLTPDSSRCAGALSNGTYSGDAAAALAGAWPLMKRHRSCARCSSRTRAPGRGRLARLHRRALALLLPDVALEEVVEKGADHRDRADAADGLPAGAD